MAGRDFSDALLSAVMLALVTDPSVSAIVGASVRDYVDAEEQWPFLRVDPIAAEAFEASGWVGSECSVTVHAFAEGGRSTKPIQDLDAAIVAALDEAELPLDGGGTLLSLDHRNTIVIADEAGPDHWHGVVRFSATVVEALPA